MSCLCSYIFHLNLNFFLTLNCDQRSLLTESKHYIMLTIYHENVGEQGINAEIV